MSLYPLSSRLMVSSLVEPSSYLQPLKLPTWCQAMDNEYQALLHWSLVPRSSSMNIIGCKWVYKLKTKVDGIGRYKTRLVARVLINRRLNYSDTFSPVVHPTTIKMVLSIAIFCSRPILQLDIQNAFLHGYL